MSRTSRQTMSAEQRREQAAALHASIADQAHALRGSEEWRRFLDFSRSFHTYSLNNVLLILAQRPTATAVAGYRQWQTKGRQVRKGEQAIRIFGYSTKRITEEDPATGEELEKRLPRFPVLSVFDITQTDLIDGEEDHATIAHRLTGTDDLGIAAAVSDYLTATGWTVTREQLDGHTNGYTTNHGRRVVIETHLSPAQGAKTLLHEAAHITLGHLETPHSDYLTHRGVMECEAESVAYVLAGLLGLDTSAYSIGYIATWSDPDADTHAVGEDIHATASRVLGAVHTLADALEPATIPPTIVQAQH
ncbi:Antirestriction protein ArdC [Georgenia satyanarayanai]|uniref:Antirestriction protein ArdC n=1 Tax=Georgenia satyanarayanai TaxID=860221 RepID=A0A2Y9ARC3_9MICO|nr:ArdC-like ssDNA-binding domain-containing protein [Georgenia satyanarayanai]PYF96383.1 antirestriction protein ArdC [Georgenia satyanarayanai]SSA46934.1 Antirestriction protein ArdC [Georgenia satyanarayanai]